MTWRVGSLIIAILCFVACYRQHFTEPEMVGEYYLYVNSPYTNPKQPADRLVLAPGGRYSHQFTSATHEMRQQSGSWSLRGNRVYISRWADYADVMGLESRGERVLDLNVIVESRPPVIVIDDDQNIFYSREPQPKKVKTP